MNLDELNLNRNLTKEGGDSFDSVVENNIPDAGQVITGTVITDCIIQTSSLPNRIEIANNDIIFYNDTYLDGGVILGDTSRLVFGRGDRDEGTFIMEQRTSILSDYDSVLSWYVTEATSGYNNWMFIGRNGDNANPQRNLGALYFAVNIKSGEIASAGNGLWGVEIDTDGVLPTYFSILTGDSRSILGPPFTGYSTLISADNGGIAGISYANLSGFYQMSATEVTLGLNLIPDATTSYDIGSPTFKINKIYPVQVGDAGNKATFYGNVIACPLPTVENALEIIKKIPDPVKVGDRGHFGDRLYFDDLTFPKEVLWNKEIEHTNMIGLLMQSVRELTKKVEKLEEIINLNK